MQRTFLLLILMLSCTAAFSAEPKAKCNSWQEISLGVFYKDKVYRNSDLKMEFKLPEGWKFEPLEEVLISDNNSSEKEQPESENKVTLRETSPIEGHRFQLFSISPDENRDKRKLSPQIVFAMEPTFGKSEKERLQEIESWYQRYIDDANASDEEKAAAKIEIKDGFKLGGKLYPYFHVSYPSYLTYYDDYDECEINEVIVMKNYGCYALTFSVGYYEENQKEELMKMINSIKFF